MAPKVLIVLTSINKVPGTGEETGWSFDEFADVYDVLHPKVELIIASPKGGETSYDPDSAKSLHPDSISTKFLREKKDLWTKTRKLEDFIECVDDFAAILFLGGCGAMYDFPSNSDVQELASDFVGRSKPIAAVAFGTCVFVKATYAQDPIICHRPVTGPDSSNLYQSEKLKEVEFDLEERLSSLSQNHYVRPQPQGEENVVVSKTWLTNSPLITGGDSFSARLVAEELLKALNLE